MKIKVLDLKPNPYRRIKQYPIDRLKVDGLKISIDQTTFWDNLLARKTKDGYEIAYGHHRLIALKELKIKEVDIPVRNLSDVDMLRIMANENLDEWRNDPAVYTETVLATKEFLDDEIAKYETWQASNENIKRLVDKFNFEKVKQQGVGQTTILKFLGGNWKQHIIQDALNTIKEDKKGVIDKKVVTSLPSTEHTRIFKRKIKEYKIPKKEQVGLVEKIKKQGYSRHEVGQVIDHHAKMTGRIKKEPPKTKTKPKIDDFVLRVAGLLDEENVKLGKIIGNVRYIESAGIKLRLKKVLSRLAKTIDKVKDEIGDDDESCSIQKKKEIGN